MKVLFFGDYSGLFSNLREGLLEHGHEAIIVANGDGFKKIPCNIDVSAKLPGIFSKIESRVKVYHAIKNIENYDVVQLINAHALTFEGKFFPREKFLKRIKEFNSSVFLSAAGDDSYFWKYAASAMRYNPLDDYIKYDLKGKFPYFTTDESMRYNNFVVDSVDGVIPIMYEYELAYQNVNNLRKTIPIGINLSSVDYKDNKLDGKLVVFHGLNRYGFKGTRFVEEAFEVLRMRYPNDLELVIAGNLPIKDYLEIMRRANVVIDQVNSYSCGLNGIYALAMGKIVLGGAEPESLISLGVSKSPVVNIIPSVESIVKEVENILQEKNKIIQMGENARNFVRETHCHLKIAQEYIKCWSSK